MHHEPPIRKEPNYSEILDKLMEIEAQVKINTHRIDDVSKAIIKTNIKIDEDLSPISRLYHDIESTTRLGRSTGKFILFTGAVIGYLVGMYYFFISGTPPHGH